jgi:pyruvate formate lyase activating enzyme
VRINNSGVLYSLVYGRVVAEHVDPIEKKPLFHFLPGSSTYSLATVGCNFHCLNCQNHGIAQYQPGPDFQIPGEIVEPAEIVKRAVRAGCHSISYTYTEPTIFFEYALDIARLARQAGLKNVFVTNGYSTPEALDLIAPFLDAANIDLKGFSEEFYLRVAGARLAEVLACIRDYHRRGIWLEITTLVIAGENDDDEQLQGIAAFIANDLSRDVPWHISRFFPQYMMTNRPVTPGTTLSKGVFIGRKQGLRHVYEGNIAGGGEETVCPHCGHTVIQRRGYVIVAREDSDGICQQCSTRIAGVFI